MALYDTIGVDYDRLRRPDSRIARLIHAGLGGAETVLNVGAGTGSYEPCDRKVTAVEPSSEMIAKRSSNAVPVVQASAEALPFGDGAFDAAMAVLTVHHWAEKAKGLREMRRVARGPVVILTYDPAQRPWLTEYLPQLAALDDAQMPQMSFYEEQLGPVSIAPVAVPHDCVDGFLYAFWRRPEVYLDARYRKGSSSFWALGESLAPGLQMLEDDLTSGAWHKRYGDLCASDTYDAGYRLVISGR